MSAELHELLVELTKAVKELRDALAPREFMTDAEIIRRLNVPEKVGYAALHALDRNPLESGFPQKHEFWGDRRRWSKVREFLDRHDAKLQGDATRLATENRPRSRPSRRPFPAELPMRRSI